MKQKQRKAAKAVLSCLVLLLLYGCASHVPGFYGGEADAEGLAADDAAGADFSWTEDGPVGAADLAAGAADGAAGAADGAAGTAGIASDATEGAASDSPNVSGQTGRQSPNGGSPGAADGSAPGGGAAAAGGVLSDTIAVYVCGAVKKPGVYELAAGSRVYEAVAMAGGMTKEAAERSVNQAETLADGQMIVILTEEEAGKSGAEAGAGMTEAAEPGDGRVNVNTAGVEELKTLPGIGDAKAAAIVDYREKNGGFAAAADLKKVSGIGDSVFAGLEDLIRVD